MTTAAAVVPSSVAGGTLIPQSLLTLNRVEIPRPKCQGFEWVQTRGRIGFYKSIRAEAARGAAGILPPAALRQAIAPRRGILTQDLFRRPDTLQEEDEDESDEAPISQSHQTSSYATSIQHHHNDRRRSPSLHSPITSDSDASQLSDSNRSPTMMMATTTASSAHRIASLLPDLPLPDYPSDDEDDMIPSSPIAEVRRAPPLAPPLPGGLSGMVKF